MQEKGILTLFEYFQDAECFSLKEAEACEKQVDLKEPSIRAIECGENRTAGFLPGKPKESIRLPKNRRRRDNLFAG